ncbi:hypothetical protein C8R44DRAFT_859947 [Mycena epipterygia]|nr:hypothetical protein C8R44DRAFT_859947 [Mycena epipterygia]
MPVTFTVANHPANPVNLPAYMSNGLTAGEIMSRSCEPQFKTVDEMLQSSLAEGSAISTSEPRRNLTAKTHNTIPSRNGFVDTVICAYNTHHALVIRPDDVWIAILTQFNYFVNANAEILRANFVAHEGQTKLMLGQLEKNVVDPSLREWVIPNFSTTTVNDVTVSAIIMMATLKAYFQYEFIGIECGIPRVTLLGQKSDWEGILGRLEKLKEYGIETIAWYHLLRPVISRFVAAFDAPESPANIDFWQKVAHVENMGSGPHYYSGWITAFCVFDFKGKWIGNRLHKLPLSERPAKAPVPKPPKVTSPRQGPARLFNKLKSAITRNESQSKQLERPE